MPEACTSAWGHLAARAAVLVCALALLVGSAPGRPSVVVASDLSNQISSGRRSQAYYESVMLAQDTAISRIKAQSKATHRAFKQAKRAVAQRKHALWDARGVVTEMAGRLAEVEAQHAQTPVEQIPPDWSARVKDLRAELAKATSRRAAIGKALRTSMRQRQARQHRLVALKRQERAAIARRESAEAGLGAYIVEMTRLAQERAENQSTMRLSTVTGFTWPSVGRISQTYGCTGFRLNPRRGSCAHFHDGLDIVAGYGSRVASAADGVVAYAGWNPWDERGRAWLMVVSHPDGYVTRYGHLQPSEIVRVGEFVRQGQGIGRMGNTGRSTGTHLHFELLRAGDDVDPWAYLPEGMVTVKVAKPSRDRDGARKGGGRSSADEGRVAERSKVRPKVAKAGDRPGQDRRGRDGGAGSNGRRDRDDPFPGSAAERPSASDDVARDVFAVSRSGEPASGATDVLDVTDRQPGAPEQPARHSAVVEADRADELRMPRTADAGPIGHSTKAAETLACAVDACPDVADARPVETKGLSPDAGFQGVPSPERGSSPVPS